MSSGDVPLTVIHFSDLHIGYSRRNDANVEELLQHLIEEYGDLDYDEKPVFVITGDIWHRYFIWNRAKAVSIFRRTRFFDVFQDKVLITPGNHDSGRCVCRPRRGGGFFFRTDFPHCLTFNSRFHFIGLDSCLERCCGLSRGQIGAFQLGFLQSRLDEIDSLVEADESLPHRVFVYFHHSPEHDHHLSELIRFLCSDNPFRQELLKDASSLFEACKGRVDAMLFGHDHIHFRYGERERALGIKAVLGCGMSGELGGAYWRIAIDEDLVENCTLPM